MSITPLERVIGLLVGAVPWFIAILALFTLCIQRYPPNGIFETTSNLSDRHPWIRTFLPATRVSDPGDEPDGWTGQRIFEDPVYLNVQTPGPYEIADMTMEFRPVNQPMVQFGLARSPTEFELEPIYFSELQSPSWRKMQSSTFNGYVYSSTTQKEVSSLPFSELAVWNASTTMPQLSDSNPIPSTTWVSLRGSHDIWLVPVDGTAEMTVRLQSVNRKKTADSVAVRLYRGDEQIATDVFQVNGSRDTGMGTELEKTFRFPVATLGVYHVSFRMSDDVFIRSITTPSLRWVIGPRLYLGDVVGYATTSQWHAWTTDSRHVQAETFHEEGLQDISLGSIVGRLQKTHAEVHLDRTGREASQTTFQAPRGDVRIVGDGFFAISDAAFFSPEPRRLDDWTDLASEGIRAVATSYERPEDLGQGWMRAHLQFRLNNRQSILRLILSAPHLSSRAGASVDVRSLRIRFIRPAASWSDWLQTFHTESSLAWHHLWNTAP